MSADLESPQTVNESETTSAASDLPWRAAVRLLRPHQWVKNLLLFVPVVLAHELSDARRLASTAVVFVCFCGLASATYVLNDLFDIEADRGHPTKRHRPLASGALQVPAAVALAISLAVLVCGLALSMLPLATIAMLVGYLILTVAYSAWLKQQLYLDVLVLAGLYTHRLLTGGVAARVDVSPWLLAFSMFMFLGLALVKRYVELLGAKARGEDRLSRRGYEVDDLGLVETMGLCSGYLAVLVVGLYVNSEAVRRFYAVPELLWLVCPLLLYWITRIWFLARRGVVHDDPVLFAATDRASYVVGALILCVAVFATLLDGVS
jgi:4-hydroxybenzoate polyprenyltransferase